MCYRFSEGKHNVLERLKAKFSWIAPSVDDPGLAFPLCFAFFTTHRLHFETDMWWLDACDFGMASGELYMVGTIDVKPLSNEQRKLVKEEYAAVHIPAPSKVVAYLRKRSPETLLKVRPSISPVQTPMEVEFAYVKTMPFRLSLPFGTPYPVSDDE